MAAPPTSSTPTVVGIEESRRRPAGWLKPAQEASVLNARIRKRWRMGNLPVGVIGEPADLTYDTQMLGAGADTLAESSRPARTPSPIR